MSAVTWPDLVTVSEGFSKPVIVPLRPPAVFDRDAAWDAAARYVDDEGALETGLMRVFVDDRMVSPSVRVVQQMRADPQGALLILNEAQRWFGSRAKSLLEWCVPLDADFSPANYAREFTLIIGCYGHTPFGAHIDSPLERTIHFNLGPSPKRFQLWRDDIYESITGSRSATFNLSTLVGYASVYSIPSDHAFVLPENYFHVAGADELSISLVLTLRQRRKDQITRMLMDDMLPESERTPALYEIDIDARSRLSEDQDISDRMYTCNRWLAKESEFGGLSVNLARGTRR